MTHSNPGYPRHPREHSEAAKKGKRHHFPRDRRVKVLETEFDPPEDGEEVTENCIEMEWVEKEGVKVENIGEAAEVILREGHVLDNGNGSFSTVDEQHDYHDGTSRTYTMFPVGFHDAELNRIRRTIRTKQGGAL